MWTNGRVKTRTVRPIACEIIARARASCRKGATTHWFRAVYLLVVPISNANLSNSDAFQVPHDPGGMRNEPLGGIVSGLVETIASDPDWILVTSDFILRESICVAPASCEPITAWFDRVANPCYGDNRYWKFSDSTGVAHAITMASLGVGSFDGLYVRYPTRFRLFPGTQDPEPNCPQYQGPQYVSLSAWANDPCGEFEPGTLILAGGPGALAAYSIVISEDGHCQATCSGALGEACALPPPQADDRTYVVDSGPDLDTSCVFRNHGPLFIDVPVTRYAGPTNVNGTLQNASQLQFDQLLGRFAFLEIAAFDVDTNDPGCPFPEADRVTFNGTPVYRSVSGSPNLGGSNCTWRLNIYEVPIELVKFPAARGPLGQPPQPAINQVRIDIDVLSPNPGIDNWCVKIDWAALHVKCMSPIVLVHGNQSNGGFFARQGFSAGLDSKNLLHYDTITMETGSVTAHAERLNQLIPPIVTSYGVDSIHLVAHSKGGLDSRDYLARYQSQHDNTFKVLSLTTLSTPHNGSVLADFAENAVKYAQSGIDTTGFPSVITDFLANYATTNAGNPDLQTTKCAEFNAGNVPKLPNATRYNLVAADADQNSNGEIDSFEYAELRLEDLELNHVFQNYSPQVATVPVNALYQILRHTRRIRIGKSTLDVVGLGVIDVVEFRSVDNEIPLGNDVLVTIPSALGSGSVETITPSPRMTTFEQSQGRNHASVANSSVALFIIPWLSDIEEEIGDLK